MQSLPKRPLGVIIPITGVSTNPTSAAVNSSVIDTIAFSQNTVSTQNVTRTLTYNSNSGPQAHSSSFNVPAGLSTFADSFSMPADTISNVTVTVKNTGQSASYSAVVTLI